MLPIAVKVGLSALAAAGVGFGGWMLYKKQMPPAHQEALNAGLASANAPAVSALAHAMETAGHTDAANQLHDHASDLQQAAAAGTPATPPTPGAPLTAAQRTALRNSRKKYDPSLSADQIAFLKSGDGKRWAIQHHYDWRTGLPVKRAAGATPYHQVHVPTAKQYAAKKAQIPAAQRAAAAAANAPPTGGGGGGAGAGIQQAATAAATGLAAQAARGAAQTALTDLTGAGAAPADGGGAPVDTSGA
jgi:hypothetical protein